jgi:hypothetical protein
MEASPAALTPATATYLVEGYWPDRGIESFAAAALRLRESVAGLQREGFAIQAITATLIPGDDAALWIVDGPSAEVVALAYERAGLRVERIVSAVELRATSDPEPTPDQAPAPAARSRRTR